MLASAGNSNMHGLMGKSGAASARVPPAAPKTRRDLRAELEPFKDVLFIDLDGKPEFAFRGTSPHSIAGTGAVAIRAEKYDKTNKQLRVIANRLAIADSAIAQDHLGFVGFSLFSASFAAAAGISAVRVFIGDVSLSAVMGFSVMAVSACCFAVRCAVELRRSEAMFVDTLKELAKKFPDFLRQAMHEPKAD